MACLTYPKFRANRVARASFDWLNDDIRVLILKTTAVRNAAHEFVADVIAGSVEIPTATTNYVRKQLLAASRSIVIVGETVELRGPNPIWTPTLTAGHAIGAIVTYKRVTTDADSPVISWCDGGSSPNELPWTTDGGEFEVQWPGGVVATL